ncbi:MAG: metal ABC transporter ATP-binding protein [Opitutaceae bacterium]
MNPYILRFHDVSVHFGRRPALEAVDAQFLCNSLTAVVGPNGAGKTTLLRSILGWHPLSSGEIRIGDSHAHHALPRLAYLPQRAEIDWDFPITVGSVVKQGRYPHLGPFRGFGPDDHEAVRSAIQEMGLENIIDRQIRKLSGGQQQRVFLARALAQGADIFLLDEPFSNLDMRATADLLTLFRKWKSQGRTLLAVVHDLELARRYFDQAILLRTRVIATGDPDTVLSAENIRTAYGNDAPVPPTP